jgi:hypothetical protein
MSWRVLALACGIPLAWIARFPAACHLHARAYDRPANANWEKTQRTSWFGTCDPDCRLRIFIFGALTCWRRSFAHVPGQAERRRAPPRTT